MATPRRRKARTDVSTRRAEDILAPYLQQNMEGLGIIAKMFGVTPAARAFPPLTLNEQHIASTLGILLEIVDKHDKYWNWTRSFGRIAHLQDARGLILSMLSALQQEPGRRLPAVIAAVWGKTLKSFIYAFRLPPLVRTRVPTQEEQLRVAQALELRQTLTTDRQTFRNGMRDVVNRIAELLHAEMQLQQVAGFTREAIDEFLGNQQQLLEAANVEERLDDDPPPVPDGLIKDDPMDIQEDPAQ